MKYYLYGTYIMPMSSEIKSIAKNALEIEVKAVAGLEQYINDQFVAAVEAVSHSKGRFIISGIGMHSITHSGSMKIEQFNTRFSQL